MLKILIDAHIQNCLAAIQNNLYHYLNKRDNCLTTLRLEMRPGHLGQFLRQETTINAVAQFIIPKQILSKNFHSETLNAMIFWKRVVAHQISH